jgi:hypothetical protein
MSSSGPADRVEADVYTACGERIFFAEELGLLITGDGRVIYDSGNGSVVFYDEQRSEFVNGANQSLQAVLNSTQTRHIIQRGSRAYVRPVAINANDELFLIRLRHSDVAHMADGNGDVFVYATRQYEWYNPGWFRRNRYREVFFNVFGDRLRCEWIVTTVGSMNPWLQKMVALGVVTGKIVPVAQVLNRTTLSAVRTELRTVTNHPWPRLMETNDPNFIGPVRPVISVDGEFIFINPRTQQLSDFMGFPLFNSRTGLPIILRNHNVVTVDKDRETGHAVLTQQKVENAVLLEAVTVEDLLNNDGSFHVGIIDVYFGSFDLVVFHDGFDEDGNPRWRLPNGDCADGVIRDMHFVQLAERPERPDGGGIRAFFNRLLDGIRGKNNTNMSWLSWILLAVGIFLLFMVLGFVAFVFKTLKGLFAPLEAVGTSVKSMTSEFSNTVQNKKREREHQRQLQELEMETELNYRKKELSKKYKGGGDEKKNNKK